MRRVILMGAALLASVAIGQAQAQIGGGGLGGPLTNGNFQDGVNAAISGSGNSTAQGGAGGRGGAGGAGGTGIGQGGRATGGMAASQAQGGRVVNNIGNGSGGLMGSQPNDVTIRSAPNAIAPNIYGANPCSVGFSGAGSWIASGFGLGALWEGKNCTERDWYRMHVAAGNMAAAIETACLNSDQREVFKRIGQPCAVDRPRPVAQVQPVAAPVVPVGMNRATSRDPQPNAATCRALARLSDPRQDQRDYRAANCG